MGRGRGNRALRIRRAEERRDRQETASGSGLTALISPAPGLPGMSLDGARVALQVAAPERIQEIRRA